MKNFSCIPAINAGCIKDYRLKGEVKIITYDKAIILPLRPFRGNTKGWLEGGVFDNGNLVGGFTREQNSPGWCGIKQAYKPNSKDVVYEEKEVVFGGVLLGRFGHVVLECLSRLWPVLNDPEFSKKHFVFITYLGRPSWLYDFFDLIGIDRNNVTLLDKPTMYKSVIVPDESIYSWHGFYPEYTNVYDQILKSLEAEKLDLVLSKKIYLTKSKSLTAISYVNEDYFEDFFRKRGFIVISPELLSVKEQILLLNNAEEVVTTLGTLSHLAIFCKPKTKLIILNRSNSVNIPQFLINQARKLDCSFVDVQLNFIDDDRTVGYKLLGITPQWKEFVKYYFNEDIQKPLDYTLKTKSYDYIKACVNYFHNKLDRLSSNEIITNLFKVFDPDYQKIQNQFIAKINALTPKEQKMIETMIGREVLFYKLHLANVGWVSGLYEASEIALSQTRLEAFVLHTASNKQNIEYGALNKEGWTKSKLGGVVGVAGKSLPITAIYIKSEDPQYNVQFRALVLNNKSKSRVWTSWIANGETYTLSSDDEIFVNLQIKVLPPEFPASLPNANSQSSINKD